MDQGKFVALLQSTLEPNTATLKQATTVLKKDYYPNPEALALLLQISTSHDDAKLRQVAAVQALSQISKKWKGIPDSHKPKIRNHLLQSTFTEQVAIVRHSNARVIAAIAKIDLADGQWADLPSLLQKAALGSQVQEREVSTYILFTILEAMGDDFMSEFHSFLELYSKTIKDPESAEVRMNTMLGLGKMGEIIDGDNDEQSLEALQKLLPDMVGVLKQAIEAESEEKIMQGFEVFQTLLDGDSKLLNKAFRDIVTFMATIAGEKSIGADPRVQAQNFLLSCVMYRKLKIQSLRIADKLVTQAVDILTECGGAPHVTDDDDELSLELATLSLLGIMSSQLPASQVVGPLIPIFKAASASPDAARRQAGISALGTCVEGAPEFLDTQIKDLIPIILQLLGDPDIRVREAATSGTKMLADSLADSMGKEHQKFMTALVQNISLAMQGLTSNSENAKTCASIVVNCCTAIDSFVEGLDSEDIEQYLSKLIPLLGRLSMHDDFKIKSAAIGATGSIAQCAKEGFAPYFKDTMEALSPYVRIKDSEDEMDLRSMTIDAMGNIADAVGAQAFQPYVAPLMAASEEGLHLDHARLKETSYMFWGTIAKVYKGEFKPFLSGVLKGLHDCLKQDEDDIEVELGEEAADLAGQEVMIAGRKVKVAHSSEINDDDEDGMDDEDDSDDGGWADLAGAPAIAEEKEIAMEAIAEIMVHTGREFLPYLQSSVELLLPLADHPYEATKRAAISTLWRAYASLWQLQEASVKTWEPGLPVKIQPSSEVVQLGNIVMTATLNTWPAEDDKGVVLDINRNLAETFKLCGPSILAGEGVMTQVTQTLVAIITKKHVCQQEYEEDSDFEPDEESSEDDWYVIETALDTIAMLAGTLGEQFAELWEIFEKPVLSYASGTSGSQRSATVGCIADVIKGMKGGVTASITRLLKILLHRMSDEDSLTKSNAAFAMGLLVQHSGKDQEILKAYNTILGKLEPLLHTQEMRQLDNAAGCVSRMIMKHKDALPLGEVLPALVQLLPLKEDFEENEPVYSMIVQLYGEEDSTIQGLTGQILPVLDKVMGPPEDQLSAESRAKLVQLVTYLHGKQAGAVQGYANLMAAIRN